MLTLMLTTVLLVCFSDLLCSIKLVTFVVILIVGCWFV